ncbi:GNAT family N-acetyltransferase [Streptomyces ovatisporus]|uniref:GNAT family N-acetyltransferase n=1 Tax=Streptomyces ovatisporus TaxID=1128682 RepID=A0ABV9A992_9ACTN
MNRDAVLAAYDRQMRRNAAPEGPGARVEQVGGVVRQCGANADWSGWTGVLWSDLDEATAGPAIAAQISYFTAGGREFEWKLYAHDRPGDLAGRLQAAGFSPGDDETLMIAEASELSADAELPRGVRLREVTDPADVRLVTDVHEKAFGTDDPQLRARLRTQLAECPGSLAAVVVMAGEEPVCAARLELPPERSFAGLWGGGTVPGWRGRGLYRALVAYRVGVAVRRGYRYVQVDASSDSRPILQRLGFVPLSTTTPYTYRPRVRSFSGSASCR